MTSICIKPVANERTRATEEQQCAELGVGKGKMVSDWSFKERLPEKK